MPRRPPLVKTEVCHWVEALEVRNCTQIKSLKNQYLRFAGADGRRPRYRSPGRRGQEMSLDLELNAWPSDSAATVISIDAEVIISRTGSKGSLTLFWTRFHPCGAVRSLPCATSGCEVSGIGRVQRHVSDLLGSLERNRDALV